MAIKEWDRIVMTAVLAVILTVRLRIVKDFLSLLTRHVTPYLKSTYADV